ncbi:hypothetical protein BKK81_33505 (plasmid) [Cupriavidus sp. USMAHM13]|uniref:hypothetical protein n=1 Tax=Cupriavidus sp. USMAHM13 TaxID=1389192 RepID=UPI0008A66805|nr:hypothetical protein BKK81_33505 [Cupriavidus sp. USMAHM13]
MKQSDLLDRLDVLLGGHVAEKIVYGDVSTGAQKNLQRATDMARRMITQFGMSEQLGLATYADVPNPLLSGTGVMARDRKEYGEEAARAIDVEVRKILAEASARVQQTLQSHRSKLDVVAKLLLQQAVVGRSDLEVLLSEIGYPVVNDEAGRVGCAGTELFGATS